MHNFWGIDELKNEHKVVLDKTRFVIENVGTFKILEVKIDKRYCESQKKGTKEYRKYDYASCWMEPDFDHTLDTNG